MYKRQAEGWRGADVVSLTLKDNFQSSLVEASLRPFFTWKLGNPRPDSVEVSVWYAISRVQTEIFT